MSKHMTMTLRRLCEERLITFHHNVSCKDTSWTSLAVAMTTVAASRRRISSSTHQQPAVGVSKPTLKSPGERQINVVKDLKHVEVKSQPDQQLRLVSADNQSLKKLSVETKINPPVEFYRRELPRTCISFCSEEGKVIFAEALGTGHMDSYFQLASQFMTQDEPAYCGLSTLVMVLNALEVDPNRVWKAPWRWYNEKMLDCCVPLSVVRNLGLTLDQFACLAACNTLSVQVQRTDSTATEQEFRALVESVTKRTDRVVVASYSREALSQTGDGHFSSVGGYHPTRDLVLMMDTARFKYPPHWVPLTLLYSAMHKIDLDTGLPRGYLLLSKSRMPTSLVFHLSTLISPIKVDAMTSSNVAAFIQSWESWLLESHNDSASVISRALTRLADLVELLDEGATILTTRVDEAYDSNHRYAENLSRLIHSVEESSVYVVGHGMIKLKESDGVERGGVVGKIGTQCNVSHSENGEACKSNEGGQNKNISDSSSAEVDRVLGRLNQAHFSTMFLLSWPYHRCGGKNNAAALREVVASVMKRDGNELLDKETGCLRQQLGSILAYVKRNSTKPS